MITIKELKELKNINMSGYSNFDIEKGIMIDVSQFDYLVDILFNNFKSKGDGVERNKALLADYDSEAKYFLVKSVLEKYEVDISVFD